MASHFTAAYASEHSNFAKAVADDRMSLGGHMVYVKRSKRSLPLFLRLLISLGSLPARMAVRLLEKVVGS